VADLWQYLLNAGRTGHERVTMDIHVYYTSVQNRPVRIVMIPAGIGYSRVRWHGPMVRFGRTTCTEPSR